MVDLTGKKYGRLTVLKESERDKRNKRQWLCVCDCGNKTIVRQHNLTAGTIKSCGCLRNETASALAKTHGMSRTRLYRIWLDMRSRCNGSTSREIYFERNITVCDEWRNSFENFKEWAINNGYKDNLSIDRIDNDKGYEPNNCRWATTKEQARNKRSNVYLTLSGKTQTLTDWSAELQIPYTTLQKRMRKGLPVEMVLRKGTFKYGELERWDKQWQNA